MGASQEEGTSSSHLMFSLPLLPTKECVNGKFSCLFFLSWQDLAVTSVQNPSQSRPDFSALLRDLLVVLVNRFCSRCGWEV